MIQCENLYMRYDNSGREVLRDISFGIPAGSFHFISGASGAGKSSLLKLLSFSHRAARGKIHMFGEDVTRIPHDELPRLRKRIGMVFQDFRLLDHLTVAENVGLPLKVLGESPRMMRDKVKEMMEWVGIGDHYHSRPEILSGGQKQRAAIARAVITKPDLLLADEPSGNLDAFLRDKFMFLFEELNRYGTTILYATHDEELIAKFNYPVLRIQDGGLV